MRVRSLVRAPQKIVQRPYLTAVAFDFDDAQSHETALGGVDVLALITPALPTLAGGRRISRSSPTRSPPQPGRRHDRSPRSPNGSSAHKRAIR